MGKSKLWIYLLTGLLLAVLVLGIAQETGEDYSLRVSVAAQGQTEVLVSWEHWDHTAYVFLPSYAQMDQVRLRLASDDLYRIDGRAAADGMSCASFELGVPYELTASEKADTRAQYIVFLRSGGVSTLFLDVQSGNMQYLREDKTRDEPGVLRLYDAQGQLSYFGSVEKVSGRGQSSWTEDKKSYNMALKESADLLGLGSAENWVLQANAKDPTQIANKLVFDAAAAAGLAYSPDSQWVDLYLNGEYAGVYLLCERIEVHPERVDISKEGSFLVTKDGEWRFDEQGAPYIMTQADTALGILYSDMDWTGLQQLWQSAENAILAQDGTDPVTGKSWQELIDLESWVKKHLLEEVFSNSDAMVLSQYYYLDGSGDGRIHAGPAWDYDLALGGAPNQLYVIREGLYGTAWPPALYEKEAFYTYLREEYATVFRPLVRELLNGGIEAYTRSIDQAAQMNAVRWDLGDMEEHWRSLINRLEQRLQFLDTLWLEEKPYIQVYVHDHGGVVRLYLQEMGALLPELNRYEDTGTERFYGWYYADTQEPVDPEKPVWQDTAVYLKYESVPAQESVQEDQEPIALTRLAPAVLFAGMLLLAVAWDLYRGRWHGKRKHQEKEAEARR